MEISIYRKPTDTGITIHNTSNHPWEHKKAAFTHHINRMLTLPIMEQAKKQEWHNICKIAKKNGYPQKNSGTDKRKTNSKTKWQNNKTKTGQ
jgi:hypothetical protein